MRTMILLLCSGLLGLPVSLYAHDSEPLFNQVHIQVQAERDIANDLMQVMLVSEHQGKTPASLARKVNGDTSWALQKARNNNDFKVSTRAYQTYPDYRDGRVIGWRVSQEIIIKSENMAALGELVGELQERLQVRNMQFSASKKSRDTIEDELIDEAMEAFEHRAGIIKKHMGDQDYRVVNIHVNSNNQVQPMMRNRHRAMAMEMADAPAVEAGTSTVTVSVSGSIQFY